jgi:hypothetical protein
MGYTWEAIHRVSLLVTLLPLKLPTIWNRARPMGLPENHKLSKVEYTDTQQDLPDKKKKNTTRHARLFGCCLCFAKSD